ncbi:MAG: type IV pilin N-terminal domain-containing protein, partial [Thermoplasmata archaeon]|nr:type IV pilin N-terminal domain-containing protein [Thermoplasmata archaeon]
MSKRRISKKLVWDDRGVSEVIGTILMLTITVVLFSSITVWVTNLPEPQGRVYVQIESSIIPNDDNDWTQGAEVRLHHVGGADLNNFWTVIFLNVDNV